jgi:tetratricopeptide (TPR) repeat protein
MLAFCLNVPVGFSQGQTSITHTAFEGSLSRFGLNHDRSALRNACDRALIAEPNYALPVFYLGVLDEADENWSAAEADFRRFLALEKDSDLTAKAQGELEKLPRLIKEDSSPSGKVNRQYRQHLAFAGLLQKQGFAKEAFLEAAEATKLAPERWEAYATASTILLSQKQFDQADHFLSMAKKRVPASEAAKLNRLETLIRERGGTVNANPTNN